MTNGKLMKSSEGDKNSPSVVFPTEDPNMNLQVGELAPKAENILHVRMEVVRLPLAVAKDMAAAVKRWI